MIALVSCLALAFGAQAPKLETRAALEQALARSPSTLPRAVGARWIAWRATDEIPAALAADFRAALQDYEFGDYAQTLARLHALLEREPDFPAALYQSGVTYFRLRRYGDAAVAFERLIEVVPAEVGITQALGHCYYSLGSYERAREHYRAVLSAAPQSVEAWRGLGLAEMRLGSSALALEHLDRALALRPEHADALLWRAQALFDLERSAEALPALLKGKELAPHEPRAWFLEAQILSALGRQPEADAARARFRELSRLEQSVRAEEGILLHEPRSLASLLRLVELHLAAKNSPEAKSMMLRALRTAPGELEVHACALQAFAHLAEGALLERTVIEIETRFATSAAAWGLLAEFHRSQKDAARAEQAEQRARSLEPAKRR